MRPLHAQVHPTLDVPSCFGCKVAHVRLAPSATPSRRGGQTVVEADAREKRWARDHPAYKRLWADGLSPHTLDGAADLERDAKGKADIEMFMGASDMVEEIPDSAA